jgi:arylsulfatase A-like enzyme
VRLVDEFRAESIANSPTTAAPDPAVSWNFSKEPAASSGGETNSAASDPTLGWKAGPGVSGLRVVDGRLTGRATTDFPIIHAAVPQNIDTEDDFYSVEVRIRSSAAGEVAVIRSNADELNFERIIEQNTDSPPQLSAKVPGGTAFQTLAMTSSRPSTMAGKHLVIRPVNAKDATFEIEFVRLVSQNEHRAMVPSGIGWQGLGSIYRESIVSRSPETFSVDASIPASAWLDVNLGTTDSKPITFKVTAGTGDDERTVLERTITTPHRWEPVAVDLGPFAGSNTLRFSLAVEEERRVGFWGTPVIRTRGAALPANGTAGQALGGVERPRRVIYLMCDTLRRDHLGLYGYERETAPNLGRLAEQGTVFLDNISQATWTKASTPSLMTSLYPFSTQVHGVPDRLSPTATTIAEVFREAGYTTVSFASNGFVGRLTNLHQGFEELHESSSLNSEGYRSKTAREYVDRAIDWIERHPDTPFFMYLHVFDPHHQYEPRAPYASAFNDAAKREEHEKERETSRPFIHQEMRGRGLPNPEELKKAGLDAGKWVTYERDWYDGSILGMDAEVGRLIERLRQLGIERDTLLVFFSDHGEGFGEHGNMWHGFTGYGEMSGVPMVFYQPGVVPAGLKISETVRNLDLMPTVLDLSGLPIPENVQGQSLVPLMAAARQVQGGSQGSVAEIASGLGWTPQPAVTEKSDDPRGENPKGLLSYAIIDGGWKLVHNVKSPDNRAEYELYHHQEDPLDLKNVLDEHADQAETLKAKLAEWHKMVEAGQLPEGESTEGISEKELERLRSLGYVQ